MLQVLYVPRHYWHDVEALNDSLSVNTWVECPEDKLERVKEGVVRALVCGMMRNADLRGLDWAEERGRGCGWLNPTEVDAGGPADLEMLGEAVRSVIGQSRTAAEMDLDMLLQAVTHDDVITMVAERLVSGDGGGKRRRAGGQ